MKEEINGTTYELAFGFGNIMEVQRLMASAFGGDELSDYADMTKEELEQLTVADVDNYAMVEKSFELMPRVVAQCLRGVGGEVIDDPSTYVRENLEVEDGMELFQLISEQVQRLNVKKDESS